MQSVRAQDQQLVVGSSEVDSDDAGVVVFLSTADAFSSAMGLTTTNHWATLSHQGASSSHGDGTITTSSIGFSYSGPVTRGDSGSAVLMHLDGKKFIFGSIVSIPAGSTSGPGAGILFTSDGFNSLMNHLKDSQHGNVSEDEPTNLIVGTVGGDTPLGSFRSDIILGRGGEDHLSDGDAQGAVRWSNDMLYGGVEKDTFVGGRGNDLFHGGDHHTYGTSRVALDADGEDTADYSQNTDFAAQGIRIQILPVSQGSQTFHAGQFSNATVQADFNTAIFVTDKQTSDVDTLISIEIVKATAGTDILYIKSLTALPLAGADGLGGLTQVDLAGNPDGRDNGDLIDLHDMTEAARVDLSSTNGRIELKDDATIGFTVIGAERVTGGLGADVIIGSAQANVLIGGGGADELRGGEEIDVLDGITGEDTAEADELYGGNGADQFKINAGDEIHDIGTGDSVFFGEVPLTGGARQVPPEEASNPSGTYTGNGLTYVYDRDTMTLTVSGADGEITIRDYELGEGGIRLSSSTNNEGGTGGADDPQGAGRPPTLGDPLILDLDGDGVEMTNIETNSVYFDTDNDGLVEQVGWVGPDDGLLARDLNGDGLINNLSELFGTMTVDGFTVLAQYDGNHDGVINASDAIWSTLNIWRDANSDGDTDYGELRTLAQVGITGISLAAEPVGQGNDGNVIAFRGSFQWANGSTGEAAAAFLKIARAPAAINTTYGEQVYFLPDLASLGDAPSLRAAMNADSSLYDDVLALVENARSWSSADFRAAFEDVLLRWAGVNDLSPDAAGPYIDARHLGFLEAVTGEAQLARQADGSLAPVALAPDLAAQAEARYATLVNEYLLRFGSQLAASEIALGIDDDAVTGGAFSGLYNGSSAYNLDLNTLFTNPFEIGFWIGRDSASATDPLSYFDRVMPFLQALEIEPRWGNPGRSWTAVEIGLAEGLRFGGMTDIALIEFALDRAHGNERQLFDGTAGDDLLEQSGAHPSTFIGRAGDDTMVGGSSSDTYVYTAGDGADSIEEYDDSGFAPADRPQPGDWLLMVGLNKEDVTITAEGDDLILTIGGGGTDGIRLVGQLAGRGIEQIVFANGDRYSADDLATLTFADPVTEGDDLIVGTRFNDNLDGRGGDDEIHGGLGNDRLTGGAGNDVVYGSDGNDVYVYYAGDGDDVLQVSGGQASDTEVLRLEAIDPEDVLVRWHEDGIRLVFEIGGSQPGMITVVPQAGDLGIDEVWFDAGIWTTQMLRQRLVSSQATNGDDHIIGVNTNQFFGDNIAGGRGDDILEGLGGRDIYHYRLGDGHDTIIDYISGGPNFLILEDLLPGDVSYERTGTDQSVLVIHIERPEGGSVTIPGFNGGVSDIYFADGSSMTPAEIVTQLLLILPTEGDDVLIGLDGDDVINGLGGDDYIEGGIGDNLIDGGDGNDTIMNGTTVSGGAGDDIILGGELVRGGTGNDTITAFGVIEYAAGDGDDTLVDGYATLRFTDIDRAAISFAFGTDRNDLVITIGGAQPASINVVGQWLDPFSSVFPGVHDFVFADGSTLTDQQLADQLLDALGTSGDDVIDGLGKRSDTLVGRGGDDTLRGSAGGDTYVYSSGDGDDVIDDGYADFNDRLVLHGISSADVTVTWSGADAVLEFAGGGSILLSGQFAYANIERVVFDNGEHWLASEIFRQSHPIGQDATLEGTSGNDAIVGTSAGETYHGGAGDDTLTDRGGSDVFLFAAGDGHDVVNDEAYFDGYSVDILRIDALPAEIDVTTIGFATQFRILATGETITFEFSKIDFVEFSDGTRWDGERIGQEAVIRGTSGSDQLDGRFGQYDETFLAAGGNDDQISPWGGNDTFIYRPGDGFLTVNTYYGSEDLYTGRVDTDTLWLRGFDPLDVIVSVEPHFTNFGDDPARAFDGEADLVVRFRNQAGAVRIKENFDQLFAPDDTYGLEQIRFDDGTIWTLDEIFERLGTYGTALPDILFASAHGTGDIAGGGGADRIFEAGDGHVIHWSVGDGNDRIIDSSQAAALVLTDLLSTEASFSRDGEALVIAIGGETVRVENQFAPGGTNTVLVDGEWVVQPWHPGLGTIVFADDVSLSREALFQQFPDPGTPDDDSLLGSGFAEALAGGAGNDLIEAGGGDDSLDGDEGDDDLVGEAGDDILTGGTGADRLDGGAGADQYLWTPGDGDDEIADRAGRFDGIDTLRLAGVDPADVLYTRLATADESYPYDALEIRILSTGETITIRNQYFVEHLAAGYIEDAQEPPGEGEPMVDRPLTWFVQGIERIAFEDGTEIDLVALGSESYHANPDLIHVSPDGTVVIDAENLLANDLVPFGGSAAAIVAAGDAENGTVTLNADGTLTFAAAPGFTGIAGFGYTVSHGGRLSTATVRVDVSVPPPIVGTEFDDELNGTPGDDVFIAGDGYDYVYGEGGVDTAQFTGWSADFVIYVDYDGSVVVGDLVGNEGWDTHYDVELFYFAGDDTLIAVADLPPYGTEADDVITGTSRTDYLFGEGGNDTISGLEGDDLLVGGDGDDTISGGDGADSLDGRAGADVMSGGEGDDYYEVDDLGDVVTEEADGGRDFVFAFTMPSYTLPDEVEDLEIGEGTTAGTGNALANTIYGNWELGSHLQGMGGDDSLFGGMGDDLIEGGDGANVMFGDAGDDQFSGSGEGNEIDGGEGEDRLNLAGSRSDYSIARDGDTIVVQGLGGEGSFVLTSVESVYFAGEGLSFDFDDLLAGSGTPGDDLLEGDGLDNMLYGYAGNDVLRGMGGHDLLDGGTGADAMEGGTGNDVYIVGEAGDVVTEAALAGTDEVRTTLASYVLGANVERLTGLLATGQTLTGNSSANVLTGGAGADVLNGGLGSDTAAYAWSQAGVSVDLQTGATGGDAAGDTFTSIENLTGGQGADTLSGTSAANILDGGAVADTMTGRGGNDIYYVDDAGDVVVEIAGQGNDEVRTTLAALTLAGNVEILRYVGAGNFEGDGNDLNNSVYGGAGDDELVGGAGYDTLIGGAGADQLFGGSEGDVLDGGAGADHMVGGDGSDNYIVDNAGDVVVEQSGEGVDLVYASTAEYALAAEVENLTGQVGTGQHLVGNGLANLIWAGGGADTLEGGDGDDELRGNGGDDSIAGGDGADLVVGGSGIDTLTGGAGLDTFRFGGWDSTLGYADRITDFVSGVDKIDLAAVDAGFWTSGDQAFTFIGSDAFSATAGELRYHFNGTDTYLKGDWDGDGAADLVIILSGEVVPLASDFIL